MNTNLTPEDLQFVETWAAVNSIKNKRGDNNCLQLSWTEYSGSVTFYPGLKEPFVGLALVSEIYPLLGVANAAMMALADHRKGRV
jgi:hypothetical protein